MLLVLLIFCLQNYAGDKEEFLLFASFFEATMIDPSIGSKYVTFELSIGMHYIYMFSSIVIFLASPVTAGYFPAISGSRKT